MIGKRGLGRGLNELLSNMGRNPAEETIAAPSPIEQTRLPIELLQRGKYQPRKEMDFEALQELADSIRAQGIIQPIVVRPLDDRNYEIIAGERRWRGAQIAGLEEVPVIIRDIPDEAAIAMSLIENIQREDLNAIEEATALHRLGEEFDLTHDQIASAVGKSRVTITNLLRLLNLNADVKIMLERGDLEMGHARALLALDSFQQTETAKMIVAKGLSVRETEDFIRKLQTQSPEKSPSRQTDPDVLRLQAQLGDKIGAKVKIQYNSKGKGKLVISYNNLDELENILGHIQ